MFFSGEGLLNGAALSCVQMLKFEVQVHFLWSECCSNETFAYLYTRNKQTHSVMTQFIQLQHIGKVEAIEAGNLKAGMQLMWNFGHTSTVLSIDKETAKSIWITEKSNYSDCTITRRFSKTRLVAAH